MTETVSSGVVALGPDTPKAMYIELSNLHISDILTQEEAIQWLPQSSELANTLS